MSSLHSARGRGCTLIWTQYRLEGVEGSGRRAQAAGAGLGQVGGWWGPGCPGPRQASLSTRAGVWMISNIYSWTGLLMRA